MDSDDDLYDEFGNLIGDPLDSDAESSSGDELPNFQHELGSDNESDSSSKHSVEENAIVLQEDKKYYSSLSETFGPDVETIILTQDAQDIEEPLIKPVERKVFQLQELDLPETTYSKEYMLQLSKIPERVRNVAICGGFHSGKTSLIDMLVKQTHPTLASKPSLRYTDTHKLENARTLSLKAVPITLLLPDINSRSTVCNIIDTPGHINFLDEVSIAHSTADSSVICVDVVEGLTTTDQLIIDSCLLKNIPMAFVLNKIDRLVLELRLPPLDLYFKLRSIVDSINGYLASRLEPHDAELRRVSPELGNVCFASPKFEFCFDLDSFVGTIYGDNFTKDIESFTKRLWGDVFYEAGKFTTSPLSKSESSANRSFTKFVLEPIYKIFSNLLVKSDKDLLLFLNRSFPSFKWDKGLTKLDPQVLLVTVFRKIFRNSLAGLVEMLKKLPSPVDSAAKKLGELSSKSGAEFDLVKNCNLDALLVLHVTKLVDTVDSKRFYGLVKVVSGTLKVQSLYTVLGEDFLDEEEDKLSNEKVAKLYINVARYKIPVEEVSAGNIALVMTDNLDSFLSKTGTILDTTIQNASAIFEPLNYLIQPVFKVAVEPKNPSELHTLLEGFRKINRSYVGSEIKVEQSGEHVILGSGELYLDCLLHDLRFLYTDIAIKISDPLTRFAETCVDSTMTKIPIKSANGLNEISIVVEPLELQIQLDIEENVISLDQVSARKVLKWFREAYKWDSLLSRSIWSFGVDAKYPNILLDDTLPDEVDKERLLSLKNFIVQGFQWAMREGPLCGEPVRDLKFKIMNLSLAEDLLDCNGGQIIPMVRNACYAAMLLSNPRLLEPIYDLDIVVNVPMGSVDPANLVSGLSDILHKRRGNVVGSSVVPLTQFYKYKAKVPVLDSVGLETDIRVKTQGQLMFFMSMSNWNTVPGDPMDRTVYLPPLKPVPYKSLLRDCVLKTRRRKGISGEPGLDKYMDHELLQELRDNGIIED